MSKKLKKEQKRLDIGDECRYYHWGRFYKRTFRWSKIVGPTFCYKKKIYAVVILENEIKPKLVQSCFLEVY